MVLNDESQNPILTSNPPKNITAVKILFALHNVKTVLDNHCMHPQKFTYCIRSIDVQEYNA